MAIVEMEIEIMEMVIEMEIIRDGYNGDGNNRNGDNRDEENGIGDIGDGGIVIKIILSSPPVLLSPHYSQASLHFTEHTSHLIFLSGQFSFHDKMR